MIINFEELEKQDFSKELLLEMVKTLYTEIKNNNNQNIIFNEFIDVLEKVNKDQNVFKFSLSKKPSSPNDILIVTEDGSVTITPSSITEIKGNDIYFINLQINKNTNLYVTYKY